MINFVFQNPTKILFGRDMENEVGSETAIFGKRVLLHYGGGSIKSSGLYEKVVNSLKEAKIDFVELGGVKPNPRLSLIKEGIEICRSNNLDFILAVGGGSVIDSAKAIAAGVPYNGDVWDFFIEKAEPLAALPIGTILTIPAAGSESSAGSVVTNEEGLYKKAFGSDFVYPRFSILNPELAYSLPKYQVACGTADIMAHMMERYFTTVKNVELTDRLIEGALKTVIGNVHTVLADSNNYDAWAEIMWSGTIAHNGLLETGREGDWASHEIEHELSGIYDVAHGAGLAVLFPAWIKYHYKEDISRFVQFAVRVWNVENDFNNPEKTILEGISRLENFYKSIGLPITLKELGIGDDRLEEMADKCTDFDTKTVGNFKKHNRSDVYNILKLAYC